MKAIHYNDTHTQALAYAEADRSDPFTYSRIMSHIANGFWYSYKKRKDGKYDFEFYRYDKCISKGCAGSQATVMRLFRAQVKSIQI